MSTVYTDHRWAIVRAYVLERDLYQCQIRGPLCTRSATEADHIRELAAGGAPYDPGNLRAACKPCNSQRGAEFGNRRREHHSTGWGL